MNFSLNKPCYVISFIIFPLSLLAACTTSGTKKLVPDNTEINVVTNGQTTADKTNLETTLSTNNSLAAQVPATSIISEEDKFPLTQTTNIDPITRPGKRIYQFGFDKQDISGEQQSLQQHAEYLIANPDTLLIINGHSDTQGNRQYNTFLSKQRATKVAQFLIDYGVPESQLKVNGMGDSQPLNDIHNFKENRRVELEYIDSRVAAN